MMLEEVVVHLLGNVHLNIMLGLTNDRELMIGTRIRSGDHDLLEFAGKREEEEEMIEDMVNVREKENEMQRGQGMKKEVVGIDLAPIRTVVGMTGSVTFFS